MLASAGFLTQEKFHPLFSGDGGPAIEQIPNLPPAIWFLMTLGIGITESYRVQVCIPILTGLGDPNPIITELAAVAGRGERESPTRRVAVEGQSCRNVKGTSELDSTVPFARQVGWSNPDEPGHYFQKLKAGYIPGNLGFDPLGLKPTDEAALREMQNKVGSNSLSHLYTSPFTPTTGRPTVSSHVYRAPVRGSSCKGAQLRPRLATIAATFTCIGLHTTTNQSTGPDLFDAPHAYLAPVFLSGAEQRPARHDSRRRLHGTGGRQRLDLGLLLGAGVWRYGRVLLAAPRPPRTKPSPGGRACMRLSQATHAGKAYPADCGVMIAVCVFGVWDAGYISISIRDP